MAQIDEELYICVIYSSRVGEAPKELIYLERLLWVDLLSSIPVLFCGGHHLFLRWNKPATYTSRYSFFFENADISSGPNRYLDQGAYDLDHLCSMANDSNMAEEFMVCIDNHYFPAVL